MTLEGTRPIGAPPESERGLVVRAHGRYFVVDLLDRPKRYIATPKGSLKRGRTKTDVVAVGDYVWVVDAEGGEARIEAVEPRSRVLARTARHTRDVEQVILANPDQVLFLFSVANPEPHLRMLDRFLILAERQELPVIIGVNKVDLDVGVDTDPHPLTTDLFGQYIGIYPQIHLSAETGEGVESLREMLRGKVTAVAGPSGVGKSSLLNSLERDFAHEVGEISLATGKGRHTTVGTLLRRIDEHTYLADTPGMRSLAMHAIPAEDLVLCFPEFRPYLDDCQFANCAHLTEPGCAIRQAMFDGVVAKHRYESFAALRTNSRLDE